MLRESLQRVVSVLDQCGVRYALIGGFGLIARGVVRATKDLDLLVDLRRDEGRMLAESLTAAGLHAAFTRGDVEDPLAGVVRVEIPAARMPDRCDIIFPTKAWQREAVAHAEVVDVDGLKIPVVQATDLFLLKLYAGEPQNLLDAASLLRKQNPKERSAWKEAAAKLRLRKEYHRCLRFMTR